ncbi:glycosyltransferase involved in cell wall biosynthesis [Kribbella aluminosa]|uniref:Glycosyltransferase involved in cell wall biosynthesis n=1 Tax=Kribbella aluminosa TaxID=416017 RepID=A0ABS4URP7_9ACTN|nr:glycosyltransferase [Kribbella aluminosa]MBP2354295.1 glycosyltransferase involved in cell wall biosynthesis [Kribbella aluminosa]
MTDAGLRVVMMVANDVTNDSRVRKEAAALAETGAEVTVLGVSAGGLPSREILDGALIVRVAVPYALREERKRSRTAHRSWRPPLVGYRYRATYVARSQRIAAELKELKADSGHAIARAKAGQGNPIKYKAGVATRLLRRARWKAAERAAWVRKGVGNKADAPFKFSWRAYDGVLHRLPWPAPWRKLHPEALDLEIAFGDLIDRIEPDVVHAHDMHVIGVAARAAGRASLRGRNLKVVYDAHEYVAGLSQYGARTRRSIAAWANHEREYIGGADRVITVSPAIATRLQTEHKLDHLPDVVMNTPNPADVSVEVSDIRSVIGLASDVPLLVYSGGVTRARGIHTAVQALVDLPDVQLAVVCVPAVANDAVRALQTEAAELGVEDRLHCVDPVKPDEVVAFLRTADVGLIPILRYPSHEMALPNKLFEYAFAGLPVVVSDMPSMKDFVGRTRIGEVFVAEDAHDLASKVRTVLTDLDSYRERVADPAYQQEVSWAGQAAKLRELYGELTGRQLEVRLPGGKIEKTGTHLLLGPVNSAGQAWLWATALERAHPEIKAESLTTGSGAFDFRVHRTGTYKQYRSDLRWQLELTSYALREVTHLLFEAGRPMFGQLPGDMWTADVPVLDQAGIKHGLVFHGSEIRDPAQHRDQYRFSPFRDPEDELTQRLQSANNNVRRHLGRYNGAGPIFVTTPDLLEFVDNGIWLPLSVDIDTFASTQPVLEREVPVVLHAPSASALKGSVYVDPVLKDLDARGLIKYQRVQDVPHKELAELVKSADIVVDQMLLGSYGVFACEAMAAGRVTVGHIADPVRNLLPTDLPIAEATPDDLAEVIERLVAERDTARKLADAGPSFVRDVHDGRKSVEVLLPFLRNEWVREDESE